MTASDHGWRHVALGDVIEPVSERGVPDPSTDLPYIGMEHVERESGRVMECGRAAEIRSSSPLVRPGDVLYGRLRPYLNKVAVAPKAAFASGEFVVFRGNEAVDARFLKWRLTAQDFVDYAVSLNTGDRPRVKWSQMRPFELVLPPLDQQRRIVDLLEDHLSRLDAASRAIADSLVRLNALRESALLALVADAQRTGQSETHPLGELARVSSGMTPLRGNKAFYDGGTIPWVTSGDLHQGLITKPTQFVTQRALDETNLKIVPAGSLLVAMYGEGKTRGTAAELGLDATTNQACAAITLHEPDLRAWVRLILDANYTHIRRLAAGGVQPNLNLSLIKAIEVPVPPADTQRMLISRITCVDEARERMKQELLSAQRRGTSLRTSLLKAAFSGRLTNDALDLSETEETITA